MAACQYIKSMACIESITRQFCVLSIPHHVISQCPTENNFYLAQDKLAIVACVACQLGGEGGVGGGEAREASLCFYVLPKTCDRMSYDMNSC